MPKKTSVPSKTKSKQTTKSKASTKAKTTTSDKKGLNKQVNKYTNIQNDKDLSNKETQTYLFSPQETDLGHVQIDSLTQKKAKDLDFKEAWYCPSKELHEAFRFYAFQNNMKKSNIITKAIVEMLEREGFLKKS